MIADWETNKVYFSKIFNTDPQFTETAKSVLSTLENFNVKAEYLPATKDIWARDYMPIQISKNKFIEFRYDPDYLQGKRKGRRNLKTYPDIVCSNINLLTEKSDIILDGGNCVKSTNCVILTDKIIKENHLTYSKNKLIKELHTTFQVEKIVIIPQDKYDEYGHADGMLRFINDDTVLINHNFKDDSVLANRLKSAGLKTEFIEYNVKTKDKLNWAYLNFLQTKDLILLPKFGIDEDEHAIEQISIFYPDYKEKIAQVELSEVVKLGGALNCITWTKKE